MKNDEPRPPESEYTANEHDVDDWDKGKDDLMDDEERVDYP